jgi:SagB-type dehydrogenase family enzyme
MSAENKNASTVGDDFQRLTKYGRESMKDWSSAWDEQVSLYKSYPKADTVELPDPEVSGGRPLWNTIASRRSFREFEEKPVELKILSQLLWACTGITARARNFEFRSAPSAGALYPVESYVVCNHVSGAGMGLYHYNVLEHKLELLRAGDLRDQLMKAGLNQGVLFECAVAFLWTAVVKRCSWKYRQRAYRYIYLDAGHAAQNLALAAESLGLGCCLVGAFFDGEVNGLLETDGVQETIIYMCAIGPR